MDYEVTKRVLAALEEHEVRYAVFGAVALNLHGLARFTADLDIFVEPTKENILRLKKALKAAIDDPDIVRSRATICWASIRRCNTTHRTSDFISIF